MRRPLAGLWLVGVLGMVAGGCSSRTAPPEMPSPAAPAPASPEAPEPSSAVRDEPSPVHADAPAECALLSGPGEPISTVALIEPVDPAHAPHPTNASERLLFRQLYETLVERDCRGVPRPGLAVRWEPGEDGRSWTLTLRQDATFTDGTPVAAADVIASWSRNAPDTGLRADVARYIESAVSGGDRTLHLVLRDDLGSGPLLLADTRLAVVKRVPGTPWPVGTAGRAAATSGSPAAGDSSVITVTTATRATTGDGAPRLVRFLVGPERDPRDFLDEGADLVLTRDPATLAYAATLPQYQAVPLAWSRTRVFVSRWREATAPALAAEGRARLAAEGVRGDARGAEGPGWWEDPAACRVVPPRPPGPPPASWSGRVVYPRGDDASRDLAERMVGLSAVVGPEATSILDALGSAPSASRTYRLAIGLSGDALAAALRRGEDSGFVVSLPTQPLDPCHEWQALVEAAPWLTPQAIVPLVDTRLWAVAQRGRSGLEAGADGVPLLTGGVR